MFWKDPLLVKGIASGIETVENAYRQLQGEDEDELDPEDYGNDTTKPETINHTQGGDKMPEDYDDSLEGVVEAAANGEYETFEEFQEEASEYLGEEMTPEEAALYEQGSRTLLRQEAGAKHEHWDQIYSDIEMTEGEIRAVMRAAEELAMDAEDATQRYEELYITTVKRAAEANIRVGERLEHLNDMMGEGAEALEDLRSELDTPDRDEFDRRVERMEAARQVVDPLDSRLDEEETEE